MDASWPEQLEQLTQGSNIMRIESIPFYDRPENKVALRKLIAIQIADGWTREQISEYFYRLDCRSANDVINTFFINTSQS